MWIWILALIFIAILFKQLLSGIDLERNYYVSLSENKKLKNIIFDLEKDKRVLRKRILYLKLYGIEGDYHND